MKMTYGQYGVGIDATPAGDVAAAGAPGFQGMDLSGPPGPGLSVESTKRDNGAPYIYHFPDGNASIARLLVRSLIPGSAPGNTMEDIVTAKMNYAALDDPKLARPHTPEQHRLARNQYRRAAKFHAPKSPTFAAAKRIRFGQTPAFSLAGTW